MQRQAQAVQQATKVVSPAAGRQARARRVPGKDDERALRGRASSRATLWATQQGMWPHGTGDARRRHSWAARRWLAVGHAQGCSAEGAAMAVAQR